MAGAIRQPIDAESLSRYLGKHVPIIKLPVEIKQVGWDIADQKFEQFY